KSICNAEWAQYVRRYPAQGGQGSATLCRNEAIYPYSSHHHSFRTTQSIPRSLSTLCTASKKAQKSYSLRRTQWAKSPLEFLRVPERHCESRVALIDSRWPLAQPNIRNCLSAPKVFED